MANPDQFSTKDNFSLVQYLAPKVTRNHLKFNLKISEQLDQSKSYLDMGMGAGFLEAVQRRLGHENIVGVEWEKQEPVFRGLRKVFDVDNTLSEICISVFDDDFTLSQPTHDYVVFNRFFPINKKNSPTVDDFNLILEKFKPYAKGFILADTKYNYYDGVLDRLENLNTNTYDDPNAFQIYTVDQMQI
jgi:hypothetical protein|tara:strand:+ start:3057 stop:3620 length:564 start_codon:yes stop_codon:yes gene_type:complete